MPLHHGLAALRPPAQHQQDPATLARSHFQNDLTQEDRDTLRSAASTAQWSATLGSLVGIGIGCLFAYRVRALRRHWFHEVRVTMGTDRPARLVFASGKSVDIPHTMTDNIMAAPSPAGDLAAYMLLGIGGLFLGGETGLLAGSALAGRKVSGDPERAKRVVETYRRFKVDALRKEADALDNEDGHAGGEVVW